MIQNMLEWQGSLFSWSSFYNIYLRPCIGQWGNAPAVSAYPLIGVLPSLYLKGLYATFDEFFSTAEDHGMSYSHVGPITIVYLRDPALLRQVLVGNAGSITRHSEDGTGPFCILHRIAGMVPALADGKQWRRWRSSLIQELYKLPALRKSHGDMLRIAQKHISRLKEQQHGKDLLRSMQLWALDTIWYVAMDVDNISETPEEALSAMSKFSAIVGDFRHLLHHAVRCVCQGKSFTEPDPAEIATGQAIGAVLADLFENNKNNIDPEKPPVGERTNLLKKVSQQSGGTSANPVTEDMFALAKQIFAFGHETPAQLIFWSMYELGNHPKVTEKLRAELRDHEYTPSTLDFDGIQKLPYLNMVYNELLRIHPPIQATARKVIKPITLTPRDGDRVVLPIGTQVFSSIHSLHHDKHVWGDDAAAFRPDRWEGILPNILENKCEYLPFLIGPRACPASNYVQVAVKSILALLLMQVDMEIVNGATAVKASHSTAYPTSSISFKVHELSC
jgi:cytochrome P450